MLLATQVGPGITIVAYGVVLGTMQGMSSAINLTVYPHYFGRAHQGAIRGVVATVLVAGTAAGPLLLAVGEQLSGSYRPVLATAALAPLAIAIIVPWLKLTSADGVR